MEFVFDVVINLLAHRINEWLGEEVVRFKPLSAIPD